MIAISFHVRTDFVLLQVKGRNYPQQAQIHP